MVLWLCIQRPRYLSHSRFLIKSMQSYHVTYNVCPFGLNSILHVVCSPHNAVVATVESHCMYMLARVCYMSVSQLVEYSFPDMCLYVSVNII